jgi:hypothetical protein
MRASVLDRSVWALEASALALAASAWVLAASAPYRSGRHVCDGAYRARCPPAGAIANAPSAGLGQQEAALFQARLVKQARPLGVMAACHGVPRKQNRWPLSGSSCRINTDRSRPPGRAADHLGAASTSVQDLLGLAAKIVA